MPGVSPEALAALLSQDWHLSLQSAICLDWSGAAVRGLHVRYILKEASLDSRSLNPALWLYLRNKTNAPSEWLRRHRLLAVIMELIRWWIIHKFDDASQSVIQQSECWAVMKMDRSSSYRHPNTKGWWNMGAPMVANWWSGFSRNWSEKCWF